MDRRMFLASIAAGAQPDVAKPVELLDDGGWCWFEDERALITGDRLVFGTVATGYRNPAVAGQIRVTEVDLKSGAATVFVLHDPGKDADPKQWVDDHNSPAFVQRPDGKLIAMYARHGTRNEIHYRISSAVGSATAWEPEKIFVPSTKSKVTYSNLFYLSKEKRVYDFYRGYDDSYKPSYAWSDDLGATWQAGGVVVDVPATERHRPYAKYCSNGSDTVHIAYTEGHPRRFDNSIYHAYYRNGQLHRSDGKVIRSLREGLRSPDEGTRIFQGGPDAVAWTTDFHLIGNGELLLVYTVQTDGAGKGPPEAGMDHRFRVAHWDGRAWRDHEVAYAGSRLYPGEDDYTGLAAIDPEEPGTLFIATNADPVSGNRLAHREIFRGRSRDFATYAWTPVTRDSAFDNIRPIVPVWKGTRRALLWLRGEMRSYRDYSFAVMGLFEDR